MAFFRAEPVLWLLVPLIWLSLVLRLGIAAEQAVQAGDDIAWALLERLGHFTIVTTVLAGLAATAALCSARGKGGALVNRLAGADFATLVATSLVLVALVYTLVLRSQWQPEGLHLLVDSLLHDVIPLLFLVYWWLVVHKADLRYTRVLVWLFYPVFYLLAVLLAGLAFGWYPYPFLEVPELGALRVRFNIVGLLVFYGVLGALLVLIGRRQAGRYTHSSTTHNKDSHGTG